MIDVPEQEEFHMTTRTNLIDLSQPSSLLRLALLADAAVSGVTGLAMVIGAGYADTLLGVPAALLRYAGLSLLPFALLVVFVATRERVSRPAAWAIVAYNALWAVDSFALMVSGWIAPSALGYAFIAFQAIVVAIFAELQYMALRKTA
jgi:hypothetical protein